jgi:hypothetical protein
VTAWTDAVARLWPDAEAGGRELLFVPGAARPRLLVPAGMPAAAAGALRRYSHDLGVRRRLLRGLTATAVRAGLADRLLRDRLRVGGDGESIEDRLGELLGQRVVVSVGLGSERANRKPVLHALSPRGESLAFVKVGDTAMARTLIDREAAALDRLAGRSLRGLRVPRVLHHGDWRGLGLLVLSPLRTGALSLRRGTPVAAMAELTGDTRRVALAESAFWARFATVSAAQAGTNAGSRAAASVPGTVSDARPAGSRADANTTDTLALADPEQQKRFADVVARVGAAYGEDEIEFGAWHGDWTPWNMAWHGGRVHLWDWERYDPDVPAGLDLLHYRLQTSGGYDAWPDRTVLEPLHRPGRTAAITVELYLLELARRYLLAAQGPLGEPLRVPAARLLDLLDTRAGRTA